MPPRLCAPLHRRASNTPLPRHPPTTLSIISRPRTPSRPCSTITTSTTPPPSPSRPKRIIVAITGATGTPLALSLLHRLRRLHVTTHLILSPWAVSTLKYELPSPLSSPSHLSSLATFTHSPRDVSAPISSGSFHTDGMIIVPCSMKTLAGVRMGYDADLIVRAASVTLKERRRLVLVVRETPLSSLHLENMMRVSEAGAVVMPPVMAFYTRPRSVEEMVEQSTRRMVDLLGLSQGEEEGGEGVEDWTDGHGGVDRKGEDGYEKRLTWTGFDWEGKKRDDAARRGDGVQ